MDLHKIIAELQSEKQRLDDAIQALERLSATVGSDAKKRAQPAAASKQRRHQDEPAQSAKAQTNNS